MTFIPKNAKWYLADVVIEITVQDDLRKIIHVNSLLVNARSPEDAYEKACELGTAEAGEPYLNPGGKEVTTEFLGLKDLAVIHGKLEHGTELFFSEHLDLTAAQIKKLAVSKEKLSVFSETEPVSRPDYSSGKIAQDYADYLKTMGPEQ